MKRPGPQWKSLACAGGCSRKLRVIQAVKYVICGECCQSMNSVRTRLEKKAKVSA